MWGSFLFGGLRQILFKYTFQRILVHKLKKKINKKIITVFQRNKYSFYSNHAKLFVSYLILKKRGKTSDTAAGFL